MNKVKYPRSLSTQLLLGALLSLLIAVLTFIVLCIIGNICLDHTVYGSKFSEKMSERQFRRLQDYVTLEEITSENLNRLNAWCGREKGIYLTLYKDGQLIYESSTSREQALPPGGFDPEFEDTAREFSLFFSDGIKTQAFLYYFASDAFYFWMIGVSGRDCIESTNIGLNTCRRIMRMHGGSFDAEEKDGSYCVSLSLPVHDDKLP